MAITKNRLKRLEEKAELRYVDEPVVVYYKNGEKKNIDSKNGVVVIPAEEKENIEQIDRGKNVVVFVCSYIMEKNGLSYDNQS